MKAVSSLLNEGGKYLTVAFSGDSSFMGKGKIRISPIGVPLYFEELNDSKRKLRNYFEIIEARHIYVPQKPNLKIKSNYLLVKK